MQSLALLNNSEVSRKNFKLYILRVARARLADGPELFHLISPCLHTFFLDGSPLVQTAGLDLVSQLLPSLTVAQVRLSQHVIH